MTVGARSRGSIRRLVPFTDGVSSLPLDAGLTFERSDLIPDASMPNRKPIPARELALSTERRPFGARTGSDGTRWCYSCDTTLESDGGRSFCQPCQVTRNGMSQAQRRTNNAIPLTRAEAEAIVARADAVMAALGRASVHFERPYMNGGWIDRLMLATKELVRDVEPLKHKLAPPPPSSGLRRNGA